MHQQSVTLQQTTKCVKIVDLNLCLDVSSLQVDSNSCHAVALLKVQLILYQQTRDRLNKNDISESLLVQQSDNIIQLPS